ncbi:MAG: penicillin-binding protein 2 [Chloroflexota bacterium]
MYEELDEEELEEEGEKPSTPRYMRRRTFFKVAALAATGAIVRQLWTLQVVEGAQYSQYAEENRLRTSVEKAPRGVMYDRNGTLLVRNVPSYTVGIVPASLPTDQEQDVFKRLAILLAMKPAEVEDAYRKGLPKYSEFAAVPIKTNVSTEAAFAIEERHLEMPGVTVVVESMREYLDGPLLSHIVGYIGRISEEQYEARKDDTKRRYDVNDEIGQTGLEQIYEKDLRGFPDEKIFEVDSSEREVGVVQIARPQAGQNLVLSIDLELQRAVSDILTKYIDQYKAVTGIVMDPNNGQILAMVDLPSYDNNMFARGISDQELKDLLKAPYFPLINKAISSAFPPGSTFKIIVSSGALQAGVVTASTIIVCQGGIYIPSAYGGGAWLPCWAAHDTEDLVAGLADSCDSYFYQLAGGEPHGQWPGLGPDRLASYARSFGLGAVSGIDLPGETTGLVPDPAWKEATYGEPWYSGDTYIMGIGQSFLLVTPLQMLNAMCAIANDGTLYRPQIVKESRDEEGNVTREFRPEVIRELPIDKSHLAEVREGLRANMTYGKSPNGADYWGTAWDSEVPGINMAGKTGTAESVLNEKGEYDTHGWFAGYAPHENPQVAVIVFVQNGKGPQDAAHRVADIMRYIFKVPETKEQQ